MSVMTGAPGSRTARASQAAFCWARVRPKRAKRGEIDGERLAVGPREAPLRGKARE